MKFSIYLLMEKGGNIRYVGITKNDVRVRLAGHLKDSRRRNTYRDKWIASLGYPPLVHVIEETDDTSREAFWISTLRSMGARLTNLTDGGEGISGYRHTDETKKIISQLHKGTTKSEKTKCL